MRRDQDEPIVQTILRILEKWATTAEREQGHETPRAILTGGYCSGFKGVRTLTQARE